MKDAMEKFDSKENELLEERGRRTMELRISLWEKLGQQGLEDLSELLLPMSSMTLDRGYLLGFSEGIDINPGIKPEVTQQEFYARRRTVEHIAGNIKKIFEVANPPETKEKKV